MNCLLSESCLPSHPGCCVYIVLIDAYTQENTHSRSIPFSLYLYTSSSSVVLKEFVYFMKMLKGILPIYSQFNTSRGDNGEVLRIDRLMK